ncbi:MAG: hypothetical protein PVH46_10375 [Granulosicoccaceae bacterium]|jgi:hypothetical protein
MLNLGQLQQHVQRNCDISDARHAGNYTMCIFLLKMREYFRWEHDIPLSSALPKDAIGQWLVRREQDWESLEEDDYSPLLLAGGGADPFDDVTINTHLLEQGYIYSSGIGIFSKPHFFLGQLARHEQHDGINIYVASCEYARDLVAPPAMSRDDTVYVRMESLRRTIWEKVEEWQWNREHDTALYHAVKTFGVDLLQNDLPLARLEKLLDEMTESQVDNVIQHELGEIRAGRLLGPQWKDMVLALAGTRNELVARAVRDHLADSLTTLPVLIADADPARLHYYFANFASLRKAIWPELLDAYHDWRNTGSLSALEQQVRMAPDKWRNIAANMLDCYARSTQDVAEYIDREFADRLDR